MNSGLCPCTGSLAYKGVSKVTSLVNAPTLAFFEGAIDLDALFKDKPKPCISNFLAETRSSDSLSADLKDYVHGKFELCGIGISKSCTQAQADGSHVNYTTAITVSNTGIGALYDALVVDTYMTTSPTTTKTVMAQADCGGQSDCITVPALATLAPKGQTGSTVTFDVSWESPMLLVEDSAKVSVRNTITAPARDVVSPKDATAKCNIDVFPAVSVTKTCVKDGTTLVEEAGGGLKVQVKIEGRIYNDSKDTDIKIKSIVDDPAGAVLQELVGTIVPKGTFVDYSYTYYPTKISLPTCDAGTYCFSDAIKVSWTRRARRSGGDAEHRLRYVCSVQARLHSGRRPLPGE